MDVKEAVVLAKSYVQDLFDDEKPVNMALEEVEYDNRKQEWLITVGFTRPWHQSQNLLAEMAGLHDPRRSYKVVRISETSGHVVSVKNYETAH